MGDALSDDHNGSPVHVGNRSLGVRAEDAPSPVQARTVAAARLIGACSGFGLSELVSDRFRHGRPISDRLAGFGPSRARGGSSCAPK
jgi:hypothetical protein